LIDSAWRVGFSFLRTKAGAGFLERGGFVRDNKGGASRSDAGSNPWLSFFRLRGIRVIDSNEPNGAMLATGRPARRGIGRFPFRATGVGGFLSPVHPHRLIA
jgi:hypothetical protein